MKIDIWYEGEQIAGADCFFCPDEGVYRGIVYNAEGRIIGDYVCRDSVEIENHFPGIFGND